MITNSLYQHFKENMFGKKKILMCDVNGKFKLCTYSEKVDKKKPYWVLKSKEMEAQMEPKGV